MLSSQGNQSVRNEIASAIGMCDNPLDTMKLILLKLNWFNQIIRSLNLANKILYYGVSGRRKRPPKESCSFN